MYEVLKDAVEVQKITGLHINRFTFTKGDEDWRIGGGVGFWVGLSRAANMY